MNNTGKDEHLVKLLQQIEAARLHLAKIPGALTDPCIVKGNINLNKKGYPKTFSIRLMDEGSWGIFLNRQRVGIEELLLMDFPHVFLTVTERIPELINLARDLDPGVSRRVLEIVRAIERSIDDTWGN